MSREIDKKIADRVKNSQKFLVVSHIRPDADAVGSLLGLGLALKHAGKDVQMVLEDGARKYQYLPGSEWISQSPEGEVDMTIVVDCSDPSRVGNVLDGYGEPDLVVDHHKTNVLFGAMNVVEPEQVATAAILYDHLPDWGLDFTHGVVTSLLAGIVGDTIGFRTPNVNADLMRKVAGLMDLGANLSDVYRKELVMKPFTAVRYWGSGLKNIERDDGLVWTSLRLADRREIGYSGEDDADLVNVLSSVKEAEIALIFVEQTENRVKISWRARPGLDVSGIAYHFGGGGHAAAAGADIDGSLDEVRQHVLSETKQLLDNWKANKEKNI